MGEWLRRWPLLTVGCIAAPIAMYYGIHSGGNGNGDYAAARLWLPLACLFVGPYSAAPWLVLIVSFIQWPLYGASIDTAHRKLVTTGAILIAHVAVVAWLFNGGASMFVQTPK